MTKAKTYFGETLRHAINQVQHDLGSDAIIIATRRVEDGIEIDAAPNLPDQDIEQELFPETTEERAPELIKKTEAPQQSMLEDLQNELIHLRGMVENRLSGPSWSEQSRDQNPTRTTIFTRLTQAGFSTNLCQTLAESIPDNISINSAWEKIQTELAQRIHVCEPEIIEKPGVIALVGSTGVGKTTTIAKLASQFIKRHGPDQIGLITADFYRVAGRDQLRTYGRILGVPVHMVNNLTDLNHALYRLQDKRLVLVDTVGISPHDKEIKEKLALISQQENPLNVYLVMAATNQISVLQHSAKAFRCPQMAGTIITKVDECPQIGHALSVSMSENLPLAYLSTGQHVPNDIQLATVSNALDFALSTTHSTKKFAMRIKESC